MTNITVIDNFLPEEIHLSILKTLKSPDLPWIYLPYVVSKNALSNNDFYFEHMFFNNMKIWSSHFDLLYPIINKLDVKSLIKVKANLYPNTGQFIKNGLHSDQDYSHRGAVYYVNTNNGYTGFEDGTKIESVANRIMLFDSSTRHHSTHCTDQKNRLTINFNFF